MAAPALVLLADGSTDPRVTHVAHSLRVALQGQRPELSVNTAFIDHCPPTGPQVVSQLVSRGAPEIVFVPLSLTPTTQSEAAVDEVVARVKATHPGVRFAAARPIGPSATLLKVIDTRLRTALAEAHVLELDGLVLSAESHGDVRGSAVVSRRVRQWSTHHKLPCVAAASDGTGPTTAQAIATLRSQGKRHVAVGSFFLTGDDAYNRQAQLAVQAGAVAVSAPIGADAEALDLVLARYAFAAMELLDFGFDDDLAVATA